MKKTFWVILLILGITSMGWTQSDPAGQIVPRGPTPPANCDVGEIYFDTDATVGQNWLGCTAADTWTLLGDGGAGGGYDTVDDENAPLTQRTTLNFEGAGVSCADDTDQTTCTIAGGGSTTFDLVGAGTNTTAAMVVGSGASLRSAAGILGLPNSITPPATCTVGDVYFDSDAAAGLRLGICTATDTWTWMDNPFGSSIGASEVDADIATQAELDSHTGATDAHSATAANTAERIVLRDALGDFAAGTITATLTGNVTGALTGNADTATTATTANAGDSATDFFASGTIGAARLPNLESLNGAVTDGQVPDNITVSLAATATALAADGANCTAQFPLGVDASGAVQDCTTVSSAQMAAANKSFNKAVSWETPTTDDSYKFMAMHESHAVTLTRVFCAVLGGTSATINLRKTSEAAPFSGGTAALTSNLVCDLDGANSVTFSSAGVAANTPLMVEVTAVSGVVTNIIIGIHATRD